MRYILLILGIVVLAIAISVAMKKKDLNPAPQDMTEPEQAAANPQAPRPKNTPASTEKINPPREGAISAVITVRGRGDITIEMYPKAAPKTVAHIAGLIKKGFYEGIVFHRVVPDFVVQAGNPLTKTQGVDAPEPETSDVPNIPFETNNLQHVPGTLGIALRSPRSETGTSQFFINLASNHSLDGDYCVFGQVTQGMDVVQKIQKGDVIEKMVLK